MKFILMGLLKRFRKDFGREPTFGELTRLGEQAKQIERADKVVPFPKDRITDPFTPRPEPKIKSKKPETEAEMKTRMNRENKEAVENFKKKFKMDDPDEMAGGGLAGFAGDQREGIMNMMPMMFDEGGPVDPGRRKFIKILGGLAAIPILSKFIKPTMKVAQNPEVARRFSGVPAYFTKLVEKIKMFGDEAPELTTVEREVGKRYKDYELVEDLSSGDIVVKKNKQGGAMVGDEYETGVVQEEVMAYSPRKSTEDGIIPEQYEEVTARPSGPDYDNMDDASDGLDSLDEILEEVGERSKKAGGGLAYMLGE